MHFRSYAVRALALCSLLFALLFCDVHRAAAAPTSQICVASDVIGNWPLLNDDARPAADQNLHLTVALQSGSQSQIADYVNSLTDSNSPNYHKWLTPDEFGEKFGASVQNISSVVGYLSKLGLSNITVWPDRLFISADTTREHAESAFGVTIHGYNRPASEVEAGQSATYYAPDGQPAVDSSVAPLVQAIFGLSDIGERRPFSVKSDSNPMTAGGGYFEPSDLAGAYDTTALHNIGLEGQGEVIAIYSPSAFQQSDINVFAAANGIASPKVNVVSVSDGLSSGNTNLADQAEPDIDIETVLGQAPDATVDVYEAPNDGGLEIFQAVETANPTPNILSDSWGAPEVDESSAYVNAYETLRAAMAAEGISIFVASGDDGAYSASNLNTVSVSADASSAYVTAVGGTELDSLNNGAWNGEVAWSYDDGSTSSGTGSGGGLSIFIPQPSWQTGPGVSNSNSNGFRQVPDVAALASRPFYYVYTNGSWAAYGGTSCSTPLWAASLSLIEQSLGTRLGNVNPELYAIAARSNSPFHDITSGNNGLYDCTPGWDFVTGLGSADFGKLATAFGAQSVLISSFSPTSGMPGTAVTVKGSDLENASSVQFGGVVATITSDTSTQIVATVPATAVTGPVTVVTPQGTATSSTSFTVLPPYGVSTSPATLSIKEGATAVSTVTLTNSAAFTNAVALSVSGLPTGVSSTLSSSTIYSSASGGQQTSSVLTFQVSPTAAVGTYAVTVTGTSGAHTATTSVSLIVLSSQVLTTVTLSPQVVTIANGAAQQFTGSGFDQFGKALSPEPAFTWSTSGGGTITSGLFSATTVGGPYTVTALSAGVSGTAEITVAPVANPESVFNGPHNIPGTVEAEDYDTGGQGVGYNQTVNGGRTGYRTDNNSALEGDGADSNGYDLGWTTQGQWTRYTVNVATAGSYTVSFRVATPYGSTGSFQLNNASGTNLSGAINVPNTGGWSTWATVTATVTLPSGKQTLTLAQDNGNWNIDCMTFTPYGAPSAPTGLTATAGKSQVALSWSTVTGAGTYNVYRGTTAGGESATPIAAGLTGTTYTDSGVTNGTEFYYKTAAVGSTGISGLSNEASATPVGTSAPNLPGSAYNGPHNIPGTLEAEDYDTGGQGVGYYQTYNGGQTDYRTDNNGAVEANGDDSNGHDLGWTTSGQWTNYTVTVATAGQYMVSFSVSSPSGVANAFSLSNSAGSNLSGAVNVPNTNGWINWSPVTAIVTLPAGKQTLTLQQDNGGWNIDCMTFTPLGAPSAPSGLTATAGSAQVALTWSAVSGAATYNVYRGTTAGGEGTTPIASGVSATSYTDSTVTNGTPYYYKLAADSSAGVSGLSNEATATPTGGPAPVPPGSPYNGPHNIPGTVEAEDYDTGGQGVGYNQTVNGGRTGYRTDNNSALEGDGADSNGYDLGWTTSGQWTNYTVTVATAGQYTVSFRIASPSGSTGSFQLNNSSGADLSGVVSVPTTGGWSSWSVVTATVTLPAGQQTLTLQQDNNNWNIDCMTFASAAAPVTQITE